ncbi:MAG: Cys-tRNA(Pro) deacylase [Lachnospiraceae bacterium]|nr:Cys-tRNA(Pro) deacylase [Lachnospiraceae bacterium]
MAKKNADKTNVMRILEQHKINYESYDYSNTDALSGVEVAKALGEDPNQVFKTLVTIGNSKNYYVFMIPVHKELNLKEAAKSVSEKNIAMIKSKELLPLTGYIHGGCSPIGMKKQFKTVIDSSAENLNTIIFSGGKIGFQVEVAMEDLKKVVKYELGNVAM